MKRIVITCPKCGWEQNAAEGALKVLCCNDRCLEAIVLAPAKGGDLEASRSTERAS